MPPNNRNPTRTALIWATFFIPVLWLALLAATTYTPGISLFDMLDKLTAAVNTPLAIEINEYTPRAALISVILYGLCISVYYSMRGNYRYGEEYGTARWGLPGELNSKYIDRRHSLQNIIFTRRVKMGMDSRKHRRNRAYYRRNEYMADHADRLISVYDDKKGGGTGYTVTYAKKMGLEIVNIDPNTLRGKGLCV